MQQLFSGLGHHSKVDTLLILKSLSIIAAEIITDTLWQDSLWPKTKNVPLMDSFLGKYKNSSRIRRQQSPVKWKRYILEGIGKEKNALYAVGWIV